jgi:hypothetical protein
MGRPRPVTGQTTPGSRSRLTLLCLLVALVAGASLAPAAQAVYWEYPGITQVRPVEGAAEMTEYFAAADQGDIARTYTYTSEFSPSRIDHGEGFGFTAHLTMHDPPSDCAPETEVFEDASGSFGVPRRHEGDDVPSLPGVNYWALPYAFYNFGPSQTVTVTTCDGETTEIDWVTTVDGDETVEEENVYTSCYYHLMDDQTSGTSYREPGDAANAGTISVLSIGGADCTADACDDEIDEDNDGYDGYPEDPGCTSSADVGENEFGHPCDDGVDNDGDASADFRLPYEDAERDRFSRDVGCESPTDQSEGVDECDDEFDNDEDGLTDYPLDPGCTSESDPFEHEAGLECDDGIDNDGDELIDFQLPLPADMTPPDPGCESVFDTSERDPQCMDGYTNDKDDLADYPADPGCASRNDDNEYDEVELTVTVDGPGTLYGCETSCVRRIERGERIAIYAIPLERIDGLERVEGCDVLVVERCEIRMQDSRTVSASFNPVITYAPSIRFSKGEKHWPMDPNEFVATSLHPGDQVEGQAGQGELAEAGRRRLQAPLLLALSARRAASGPEAVRDLQQHEADITLDQDEARNPTRPLRVLPRPRRQADQGRQAQE